MEKKYLKITPPKGEGNVVVVPYSANTEAFYKSRNKTLEKDKSDKRYKIEEAAEADISAFNPSVAVKTGVSDAKQAAAEKAKVDTAILQAKLDEAEKAKEAAEQAAAEKAKDLENQLKAAQAELKKIQDKEAKK